MGVDIDLAQRGAGEGARLQAEELKRTRSWRARCLGQHTDEERAWRSASYGEQVVGAELARLVSEWQGWRVLHGVGGVSHLVIGPGGVFAITAKHHPCSRLWVDDDLIWVGGLKTSYVRNARLASARVSRLLTVASGIDVSAQALIATVGADLLVAEQPDDVWVCTRRQVVGRLRTRVPVLTWAQVEALYDVARRSSTWEVRVPSPRRPSASVAV